LPQARHPSFTAKEFFIEERCMMSVQVMIEDHKESKSHHKDRGKSKSSATNIAIFTMASAVLVLDDSDVNVATAKDHWAKCGGISLNKRDLQKLTSGKELSDLYINAFQNVLKVQFSSIGALFCRHLFQI